MRDVLRLLAIAVLVFAIVGFAMIYSRDSAFRYGVSSFLSGTGGAVSRSFSDLTGLGRSNGEAALEPTSLRIVRPNQTSWVGLAGFPDQTSVHFSVPQLGGYLEGRLDLRFDVQLAQGGDGLLSIAVNGERRSEIVLNTGHNAYDVEIPLTLTDLLSDRVVVELAARGTTNSGQICPTDSANSGSAVSLLPESALVLTTLQEANDPETSLIAAPDPLQLYLGRDTHSQAVTIWAAQRLRRLGVPALIVDDAVAPGRIVVRDVVDAVEAVELDSSGTISLNGMVGLDRAVDFHRADPFTPAVTSHWPVSVEGLTSETMARNFRGSKRWTIPYDIADLPGGLTPTRFDLALRTSLLADGEEWIVRVSLNGNLLSTQRFDGTNPDIKLAVDLPHTMQRLSNALLVELIDTSPNESICRAAPDAQAQLLPESRLIATGEQPTEGWGALVRELADAPFVVPGNHGRLSVNQATRVAAALEQFLPAEANVAFTADGPAMTLTVVTRDQLEEVLQARQQSSAPEQRLWAVTAANMATTDTLGLTDLTTQDPAALLAQMRPTSMAILVQSAPAQ